MDDGSRGAGRTHHPKVVRQEQPQFNTGEDNLRERWGGGSSRVNTAKPQALGLGKYSPKLNPLRKSPVQVNRNNCIFFPRDFLLNDLTEHSNYYPATELLSQIRNLQKRHCFLKPSSTNL